MNYLPGTHYFDGQQVIVSVHRYFYEMNLNQSEICSKERRF